ncbi:glycosyltransferase family 39 protein [Aquimarina sp. MMG015]|uniref:glycosyltransferase family 39 protein n=1 Tax=Aquimarina TaxID=290174 RepID=UPI00041CBCB2|nr:MULTISPECIES: glycosyltransferase family 39 protein [Aquimarina]MBQ4802996.1 glycosyltransferase family 39 protein [Aquimarina sp. MMG015]
MIWNKTYSSIAILFSIVVLLFHILLFSEYTMPLLILLGGLGTIFLFFVALYQYAKYWEFTKQFKKKLFLHSVVYRTLAVIAMYVLTMSFDADSLPFEIGAIDSVNYHISGELVEQALEKGISIQNELSGFWKGASDYGFSVIIGFLYYIFGAYPLVVKIFNILVGSLIAIRIYQITQYVFDEKRARLSGILVMLMPPLLWFSSMVLKETFLMFIIVNVGYLIIKLVHNARFKWLILALIVFQVAITLYFRTVIAPLLLICILLQIIFLKTRKKNYRILSICVSVLMVYGSYIVVEQLGMKESVDTIIAASQNQFDNELSYAAQSRGISYTKAIVAPLLIAGAIVTPFPSLLNFEEAQLGIYAHFFNEIIRNSLYFFVFVGLFRIVKHRNKGSVFISSFSIGYILILAISGISFQDRFQVLALPFLIIFMADGIFTNYLKKIMHWKIYLCFIFLAILMWNLFKLSNRGLL